MPETFTAASSILILSAIAEAIVEHIFSPILDTRDPAGEQPTPDTMEPEPARVLDWPALTLRYISVLIGVALCIVYQVDLLAYFNLQSPWPWVGWLITGVLIGRGSNFIHDFASRWLTKPD